ncbi:titin-like [Dioscorea cayenensis subsp. rotundata]|uniref:Titin-like n=1 Tax=Dioscorea cayennensis subsp. rotundata TaxID=55577 RepID=A0AB40CSY7_DIOCR|nr:titin-like [Dioscorea cayenensis subsp. rotundata]
MAAEGGMLEPISEKIIHGEIENITFDHIPKIKEAEGSPEQVCDDTLIKTEVSEPLSLQNLEKLRDGQNQPSPAATHDNGIIIEAKDENLHQVTTETVDTAGGQIFNVAPSGVQISLDDNCKDIDAGFQADSDKEEKEMPKSANINPIASDEDSKEDGPASDKGKEHGTVSEVPPKSSQDMDVEEDEGEENEEEIIEKKTSEPEISEKQTSGIEVKLMEDSQTEHEDVSPGFTATMKDTGEEPPTKEEETIDNVDLVPIEESVTTLRNTEIISDNQRATSLDDTETTENDIRALGENQNLKQDVNTAAEEEPKTHELTPASIEERVGGEDEQKASFNAALKEPGVEIEDANEEEEETTSVQRSATELQNIQLPIEESPMPSTTETPDSTEAQDRETEEGEASGQRTTSELPQLQSTIEKSPVHISTPISEHVTHSDTSKSVAVISEERVGEDEKLKESSNTEKEGPGAETQDATEEQHKTTEEGDASAQLPMSELHHLPEKSQVPSKSEDQLDIDAARASAPDYTEEKLEEFPNVESAQPCTQTQDSTEEQVETEEGDVSSHMSTNENLSIENQPAGISTSTAEAPLQEDEVKELAPALLEDRIGDDEKPIETSNVAPEIPAAETEDSVEEQEKAIEEGDASQQKSTTEELHSSLQIDKPPVPSTTEDQLKTDDARELAPGFIKENVKEEENLKESNNSETEEPGTEAQDAAEEQDKTTEKGDASTQLSASELHHLATEKSPLPSKTEDQLDIDGARELTPDYSEDQMGEEKLEESPNVESAEPGAKTQDSTEEQEETDEGDVLAHMSTDENLSIENHPAEISTSTAEAPPQEDEAKELAPALTEEDETLIETTNVSQEIPATETEDSVSEQEKATEEGDASFQKSASEEIHLPLQIEKSQGPSTSEDQLETGDARELAPGFAKAHVKEQETLKESTNEETGEPGTETQDVTEEQNKTTEEGDASAQLPMSELHHLPERSPLPSKTEDQDIVGARESAPDYTQDQVIEEEKLEESPNVESAQPCTQTQDSTEEQEETEEGDVSSHMSTGENLSIENQPAGISTSTAEAPLQEDEVKELAPALLEDTIGGDEKPIETSNVAPEKPATETEDSVEEQEKAIEEGDALQKSASEEVHSPLRMDKPPVPSTTEDQLKTSDARELAPGLIKENVKEEENLKESNNSETGEPGTEAQEAAEEQDKTTEKGDASIQLSASELHHLPTEKSPLPSKTEDQLDIDGARELAPDDSEDQMIEEEKLEESSNVELETKCAQTRDLARRTRNRGRRWPQSHVYRENLSIEKSPRGISTSTAEAPMQEK